MLGEVLPLGHELVPGQRRRASPDTYRRWLLVAAGSHMLVLSIVVAWRTALPWYFPGPGVTVHFTDALGSDWRAAGEIVAVIVLAFALFGQALAAVWGPRGAAIPRVVLFGFPVLFTLALMWMYPLWSFDLFHYQADARTFWVYGDNPLTVPPSAHPYPIDIVWADRPSPYGPVWSLLTFAPTLAAGDHYLAGLLAFKLLIAVFFFGCAWLIYGLAARVRPGWEAAAVVLFAWNPFVLFRTIGNGQNDVVMVFFLLLALWRTRERDWLFVFPALALSVLVKYVTALLVPTFLLYVWWQTPGTARARLRALAPGLSAAVLIAVLTYAPFWAGWATFDTVLWQARSMTTASAQWLLQWRLGPALRTHPELVRDQAGIITRLVFLALYLPLLWQARRDFVRLLACTVNLLFWYLIVGIGWFMPWYLIWPVAVAAVLTGTWFTPLLVAMSFSGCFLELVQGYQQNWEWLRNWWRMVAAPVMVTVWPPLVVWYFGLLVFRSWHFDAPRRIRNMLITEEGKRGAVTEVTDGLTPVN